MKNVIKIGNRSLAAYHFSGCKKPRLCICDNEKGEVVQYAVFNNDEAAQEFIDIIIDMFGIYSGDNT